MTYDFGLTIGSISLLLESKWDPTSKKDEEYNVSSLLVATLQKWQSLLVRVIKLDKNCRRRDHKRFDDLTMVTVVAVLYTLY